MPLSNRIPIVISRSACAALLTIGLGSSALAGWTFTDVHPAGAQNSYARGIRNGKFVGSVDGNAAMWTVNVPGWLNLGPGELLRTDGTQQAGSWLGPAIWTGTPGSFVSLNLALPGYSGGACRGVYNNEQVGYVGFDGVTYSAACYWQGSAGTYASLAPAGSTYSECLDVYAGQEVGYVGWPSGGPHAAVWYGNATVYDLNPIGAVKSWINGVVAGKQVGYIDYGFSFLTHAARWENTAASCVDLHPPGMNKSEAKATYLGKQAGWVQQTAGGNYHAAYWADTPGSFVDLQNVLPPSYTYSVADGIWTDNAGVNTYVTGTAVIGGEYHAVVWKKTPDQTISCNVHLLDTVSPFAVTRPIAYTIYKNAVPVASGTLSANTSFNSLAIAVPQNITGGGLLVLDGSSFLRRAYSFVLTGNNQNLGQINVSNGDADLSGEVDAVDIDQVIFDFGSMAVGNSDVDVSGEVDAVDIDIVIANFGNVDQ